MWCDPSIAEAWPALEAAFAAALWPTPPEGFVPVGKRRAMRQVLRGRLGTRDVAVKWHRPVTRTDVVARWLRGGRGPREGRLLRRLLAHAVYAPRPLAYAERTADILVTQWLEPLAPLPEPDTWSTDLCDDVAHVLARLREAGIVHRDLHGANLVEHAGRLCLVDLGGARARHRGTVDVGSREIARWARGLLPGVRRTQRLRALGAWLRTQGPAPTRSARRALILRITKHERGLARAFLAGRDRRATRSGRHFVRFTLPSGAHGIRRLAGTDGDATARAEAWFADPKPNSTPLKDGGRVRRHARWQSVTPSEAGEGASGVVGKWYDAAGPGRLPYPLRAFRRAEALRNRGVYVPAPLLALVAPGGDGLLISRAEDLPNLHDLWYDEGPRGWAATPRAMRCATLSALGRWLRSMHEAEVSHRDLKAPNLLVDPRRGRIALVDVEGARLWRRPVPYARRARDLARLAASLPGSRTERLRVLQAYWRVPPYPPANLRAFIARIDRAVRAKRGPSDRPR